MTNTATRDENDHLRTILREANSKIDQARAILEDLERDLVIGHAKVASDVRLRITNWLRKGTP